MFNFLVNRNNEALDEDIVQKMRVADVLRKHVRAVNEYIIQPAELTESQADEVKKILLSFSSTLDEYVNKLEGENEPLKNVGILLYRYNLLSTALAKVKLQSLPTNEKAEIISELDDMIPKIEELIRYAELNNFTDIDQLKQILGSFQSRTYKTVSISPVKYTQEEFKGGREEYNGLAKDLIEVYDEIKTGDNIKYLEFGEFGGIQNNINKVKKIGTKIKSDKHITVKMLEEITKAKDLLFVNLEKITKRKEDTNIIKAQLQNSVETFNQLIDKITTSRFSYASMDLYNPVNIRINKSRDESLILMRETIVELNKKIDYLNTFKIFDNKKIISENERYLQDYIEPLIKSTEEQENIDVGDITYQPPAPQQQPIMEQGLEQAGEEQDFNILGDDPYYVNQQQVGMVGLEPEFAPPMPFYRYRGMQQYAEPEPVIDEKQRMREARLIAIEKRKLNQVQAEQTPTPFIIQDTPRMEGLQRFTAQEEEEDLPPLAEASPKKAKKAKKPKKPEEALIKSHAEATASGMTTRQWGDYKAKKISEGYVYQKAKFTGEKK